MTQDENKTNEAFTLCECRVINQSLFTKDRFNDRSTPSYKLEVAIPDSHEFLAELEDRMCDFADRKWGDGAGDDEDLVLPFIDGGKLKKKREKRGKDGSAYEGMTVLRMNTIYNKDGVDGPGGIQVFDADAEEISPSRQGEIYPGCYGIPAVTLSGYEDDDGNNALKLYLVAFQKTADGEKLVRAADRSTMFRPVAREGGGEKRENRRRRRG